MIDNPLHLLSLGIWLLAAGMYPLGFMFGACSACCQGCRSDTCEGFDLEEAFSCRQQGREACPLFTQGPPLLSLSFAGSCYGSGAAGTVEGRGEDVGAGPLVSVELTEAGSGYAKFGRSAPTLEVANKGDVAATMTVTLASKKDECNVDYWEVDSVSITDGGQGYTNGQAVTFSLAPGDVQETEATATLQAKNSEPTLTATASPGTGAEFKITLQETGADPVKYWTVSSVSVTGKTSGYVDGDTLDFEAGEGVTSAGVAEATIHTKRFEPTLEATGGSGTGAEFSVELASNKDSPETWRVESVAVSGATSGYVDGDTLSFSGDNVTEETSAVATIKTVRVEPTITASAPGGSDAQLTVVLAPNGTMPETWRIDDVTIVDGGSGYPEQGGTVDLDIGSATEQDAAVVEFYTIGGAIAGFFIYGGSYYEDAGEIESVSVDSGGSYYASVGEIESVSVDSGGSYYASVGEIESVSVDSGGSYYVAGVLSGVSVTNGGKYYHPDAALAPYVSAPTVTVVQYPPSAGSGAVITATVDDDTSSPTFGEVASLSLDNAGNNYLAWEYVSDFEYIGDGKFAFGTAAVPPLQGVSWDLIIERPDLPSKGCWVSGDGIAFGTRVTDLTKEILDYGEPAAKTGCCKYTDVYSNGTIIRESIVTEEDCLEAFNGPLILGVESRENYSWTACKLCNGDPLLTRGFTVPRTYSGRWIATVDPVPEESPTGCIRFCGGSGLCGPMPRRPNDEAFAAGPYGAGTANNYDGAGAQGMRRMCVRWVCRCYEGTGKRGQPEFTDPYDWYTVESTTEVGGPVVYGGSLTEKLEAATVNYSDYEKYEHLILFDIENWQAAEGDRLCMIWRFVFFGTTTPAIQDTCNFPDDEAEPSTTTAKDVYTIHHCDRCSCQSEQT